MFKMAAPIEVYPRLMVLKLKTSLEAFNVMLEVFLLLRLPVVQNRLNR